MSPDAAIRVAQEALWITALVAAIPLLAALVAGVIIGLFQAATQINETTLSFVPKLLVLGLALAVGGPWMLQVLMDYTRRLITSIPSLVG
jgi:flagellar biosynthetic protein FliQ